MTRLLLAFSAVVGFFATSFPSARAVDNPFLRLDSVNDCDVMKYNGEYYITGNWLSGDMFSSRDLINWGNRKNVITRVGAWASEHPLNDLYIHASDPNYIDGTFHLYFQVDDKIGHATAKDPWGLYVEPSPVAAFSSNIDAEYFRDDDGRQYFYKVEFSNGNVIAGQTMADPNTLTGASVRLISATPGWEKAGPDNINEGPCVFKYRGRYYMLYNANATWNPDYQIGCVDATTPLGFSNQRKYPKPVIARTQVAGGEINTIGQPWVVEGPNGFERWVGYFAIYSPDGGGRYQCVDRLHFFDRQLFVDGPTSRYSSGYHPGPAKPTLLGLFNLPDGPLPSADWSPIGAGSWSVSSKQGRQSNQTSWSLNPVNREAAAHYLIEANFKFDAVVDNEDKAGILAHYADENNWMIIGVDRLAGNWYAHAHEAGVDRIIAGALPAGWSYTDYHKIRVERNGSTFDFRLDGLIPSVPSGASLPIRTAFTTPGRPGIYTDHTAASFDGIIYTSGWDEFDGRVEGWGASAFGEPPSGTWEYGVNGITQGAIDGLGRTFKGDLMPQYEFSCQIYPAASAGSLDQMATAGMLPVFIDNSSYLSAEIDTLNSRLIVGGRTNGVDLPEEAISITNAPNHNLRAVKLPDRVILFVDGQEVSTVSVAFAPSQVGLMTRNMQATFNGILVYRTEPLSLPQFWESRDLGSVGFSGKADFSGGTFVIDASGADIWDREDGGHFAFQRLVGDGQIIARLDSIDPTDYWAKAGLMFRENFNANARMVYLYSNAGTGGNGDQHQFIWRESPGSGTGVIVHNSDPVLPKQGWMRLVRQGNVFSAYYSTNGSAWTLIGTHTMPAMATTAYAGLAVTSHNNTRVSGAVFENVSISPSATAATMTAAAEAITYGENVLLYAVVTGSGAYPSGTVTFRAGNIDLGTLVLLPGSGDSASVSLAVNKLPAGTNNIVAIYNGNSTFARSQASAVTVVVQPKTVSITGISVADKTYDGQTSASVVGTPFVSGLLSGDILSLSGFRTATFADPSAGTNKSVIISGYTLTGSSAPNYTLVQPSGLTANIIPRELVLRAESASRYYGASNPPLRASVIGFVEGDTLESVTSGDLIISTEASDRSPVGAYPILLGGLSLRNSNYTLVPAPENATALQVVPLPLRVSGSRVFDGSATIAAAYLIIENDLDGEDITLGGVAGLLSGNAGTNSVLSGSLVLSGPAASNYTIEGLSGTVEIVKAQSTLSLSATPAGSSLPGEPVSISSTITAAPPGAGIPDLQIAFKTNGVLAAELPISDSGLAVFSTANLRHGTNEIMAEYSGSLNYEHSSASLLHVVNTPPTVSQASLEIPADIPFALDLFKTAFAPSDADNDQLQVIAVTETANGQVGTDGAVITYLPNTGFVGSDAFSYTVADPFGGSATGIVAVAVQPLTEEIRLELVGLLSETDFRFQWNSRPGAVYRVEAAEEITGDWVLLEEIFAQAATAQYSTDPTASKRRFFRVRLR